MKSKLRISIAVLIIVPALFFFWRAKATSYFGNQIAEAVHDQQAQVANEPHDEIKKIEITDNTTYSTLMQDSGVSATVSNELYQAAYDVYDLAKIRVGRTLDLVFDKTNAELKQLLYQIDSESELHVTLTRDETATTTPPVWHAEIIPIAYEEKVKFAQGVVESSMYQAALDNNIDERAIIELADAFQWSLDFAMDPRVGDTFSFVYEERYRDGTYVMPGTVLAGKYVNDGTTYYAFYFKESEDNEGYFDENGNSLQKMFLKAPVSFRYISSGYTTGARYVAAFQQYNSSHMAIDYATESGTPIRAVGDGTVIRAGWNGPYGNFISIRHNGTYTTNYAHQSKLAVKVGQKVKQGQTIGYVGSTGYSTGPHLHYEMVKNGVKVNPLKEVLPPGQSIKEENKERFFAEIASYKQQLDAE